MSNAMIGRMKCGHAVAVSDDATDEDRATFEGRGYAVELHPRAEAIEMIRADIKEHRARCRSSAAQELIAQVRELDKAATPGPWEVEYDSDEDDHGATVNHYPWRIRRFDDCENVIDLGGGDVRNEDAEFCAEARTLLPALATALEAAHETIAREQRMAENARRDAAALSEYAALARPVVEAVRAIQHNRWIWLHNRVSDKDTATQALSDMQREIRALKRMRLPKETP